VEDPVIVTVSSAWRGKPLTEMANKSAARLRSRMKTLQSEDAQAKLLNLQGVSALNRNEWQTAREDFAKAYKLDPYNAFALNNQGYISEMNGDLETAQEFYREAQKASGATSRVGIATRPAAEGDRLVSVARGSTDAVDQSIEALAATRRRNAKPIQLKRRDGTTVINEPSAESSPVAPSSQPEANPPVPDVQQDQPEPPQEPQSSSPPQ
jgi:Flp pilus assembly protein TadD